MIFIDIISDAEDDVIAVGLSYCMLKACCQVRRKAFHLNVKYKAALGLLRVNTNFYLVWYN